MNLISMSRYISHILTSILHTGWSMPSVTLDLGSGLGGIPAVLSQEVASTQMDVTKGLLRFHVLQWNCLVIVSDG